MRRFAILIGVLTLMFMPYVARADDDVLLSSCKSLISKSLGEWSFAPISEEVAADAKQFGYDPTKVYGDFDDDGHKDVALLVQSRAKPGSNRAELVNSPQVAVCLNSPRKIKLHVIPDLYCNDGISVSKKGRRYHDYARDGEEGIYKRDGVAVFCFEKASATYQLEKGKFRQIIDSD